MTAPWLRACFTPAEQPSPEMGPALRLSDERVGEVIAADHTPPSLYHRNVPTALKAWVDQIVRKGFA